MHKILDNPGTRVDTALLGITQGLPNPYDRGMRSSCIAHLTLLQYIVYNKLLLYFKSFIRGVCIPSHIGNPRVLSVLFRVIPKEFD